MAGPAYSAVPPEPGRRQEEPVVLRIEKAGRGGKTVTIVSRLVIHPEGKESLLRELKSACGAGGAVKNGELEIQGEQRARIKLLLEKKGYRVKGA